MSPTDLFDYVTSLFNYAVSLLKIYYFMQYAYYFFILFLIVLFIWIICSCTQKKKIKKDKRNYIYRTGKKNKQNITLNNCNVYIYYDAYGNVKMHSSKKDTLKFN